MNSARFCKHCGENILQTNGQIYQTPRANQNKTALLEIGIVVLIIVAVVGYFIVRGDNKTESKSNNELKAQKQQTPLGSGASEGDSYDKRRLDSFRSTAVSINPAAMQCADESKLSTISFLPGSNICSDTAIEDSTYPSPPKGVCDEGAYGIEVTDTTSADGAYQYSLTCTIAGKEQAVTCDQNGCSKAP